MEASGPESAPRSHLAYLDGLRAAAALLVVWNHVFAEVYPLAYGARPAAGLEGFEYLRVIGHFSVTLFIALSGFCLMLPHTRNDETRTLDIRRFFQRRARRILPAYYLALIFCLLMIRFLYKEPAGLHFDFSATPRKSDILSHFLLLQNIFGTGTINYVFWSIATEWQIYFLFPLLLYAFRKFSPVRATLIALALAYIASVVLGKDVRLARMSVHYAGIFAVGMLAALVSFNPSAWCERIRRSSLLLPVLIAAPVALGGLILSLGWRHCEPYRPYHDLLVAAMAFSLLILASRPGALQKLFSWKPLVFLGTFSYSIYLMHVPFLALLLKFVVQRLPLDRTEEFVLVSTVGFVPVTLACYLFFLVAERPFLNKK